MIQTLGMNVQELNKIIIITTKNKDLIVLLIIEEFSNLNIVLLVTIIVPHPFIATIIPKHSGINESSVNWFENTGCNKSATPFGNVSIRNFCIISFGKLSVVVK